MKIVITQYLEKYCPAYWLFEGQEGGRYSTRSIQNIYCHLYEFELGGLHIGVPYEGSFDEIVDASKIKINKYLKRKGDKILYTYDFGDDWQHVVSVEKVESILKTDKCPICIKGKGNCPPEDSGGIWGYYELIEIIKNKEHPDYEDMLDWLGGEFDPAEFDVKQINERLVKYQ